jgi:sec-independent protein translocase protein TatA
MEGALDTWFSASSPISQNAIVIQRRTMLEGLFQPTHLIFIFGIALLVFGPKQLPELGKGVGEGIRGFKAAMKENTGLSKEPAEPSEIRK